MADTYTGAVDTGSVVGLYGTEIWSELFPYGGLRCI